MHILLINEHKIKVKTQMYRIDKIHTLEIHATARSFKFQVRSYAGQGIVYTINLLLVYTVSTRQREKNNKHMK